MERVEMTSEAMDILKRISEYSPTTGARLTAAAADVMAISCKSTADQKTNVVSGTKAIIEDELKKAEVYSADIKRLSDLNDESMTVRCGGP